jgi:hypothetical protein
VPPRGNGRPVDVEHASESVPSVLRSTDTFNIGGCSYTIGNVPHPCVRVRWDVHAERHTTRGDPSLTQDSVGLCLAGDGATQGTVVISSTQSRASGS